MAEMYDVVVVGAGPAGLTAALYLARARYRVLVVEKDRIGGQIRITEEVVNYPGVERCSGAELTDTMRRQAESFGAEFMMAEVTGLDMSGEVHKVLTTRGEVECFGVLLCTGAHPRKLGFAGEEEFQGRGVAYCATCDGEFFTGRPVYVIGGGFAAAEESVFLTKYASHVTILMRGDDFSCAPASCEEAKRNPKITICPNCEVDSVGGDGLLTELRYHNNKTGEEFEVRDEDGLGVFVFAGYTPDTEFVRGLVELDSRGYVLCDERQKASVCGVFAAGDVCVKELRQVVTATGQAAQAATSMEKYVAHMQEVTGIVPVQPAAKKPESVVAVAAEEAPAGTGTYLDAAMKPQLDAVFARMSGFLTLELHLDGSATSAELAGYMEELAAYTEKLQVTRADAAGEEHLPFVRLIRADGTDSGLAFHGVPGGHEFTSFVLGLYNAAGPGQPIDDAVRARIEAISEPISMQVFVTLGCTMCPDMVVACQRIASLNPNVRCEVYDSNLFADLKRDYKVMSVPCLVVDEDDIFFGRKSIEAVLDLL